MKKRTTKMKGNSIEKQLPLRLKMHLHELLLRNAVKNNESINLVINNMLEKQLEAEEIEKPQI
ncbi:hypothetical protein SAMN05192566_0761 [Methylophilus rhizosphaerae]|uniref:HicB family protein n=1 Tax=Methylophilus rhizosphaerae TaxID=492660 RepID=A0A1G9A9G4_9PROT|nr:hypothetical protein [Methylophilus rhizosphaerae]SDK23938.1 hypothetical protein SAMN05192566_0761 [Methylophilus rhizosphaerae]